MISTRAWRKWIFIHWASIFEMNRDLKQPKASDSGCILNHHFGLLEQSTAGASGGVSTQTNRAAAAAAAARPRSQISYQWLTSTAMGRYLDKVSLALFTKGAISRDYHFGQTQILPTPPSTTYFMSRKPAAAAAELERGSSSHRSYSKVIFSHALSSLSAPRSSSSFGGKTPI